jgi:TonB family protein
MKSTSPLHCVDTRGDFLQRTALERRSVSLRAFILLICLGWASLARAQADGGTGGILTKAPTLTHQVEARYPAAQADAGLGGTVVMELDLGPDGLVTAAKVVQSAGDDFDASALEAVRQFTFTPAEVDGQPAAVRLHYAYTFLLRPEVVTPEPSADAGARVNFVGQLVERGTRKPLAGASLTVSTTHGAPETMSDEHGHFALAEVPEGTWDVIVSAPDCQRYEVRETFTAGQRTEVTYYVRRKVYGGLETVVRGKKERKDVTQVTLRQEEIRLIPGTNGDAFKVVQNLPGVARSAFGLGFLVVRGGKTWDTKTYIDEAQVPVLFHFGGLFATYNSNLLQDLSFQAGNFNADYGRAIGGLVAAQSRALTTEGVHGYADVNLVDASALVELPLNDTWSLAVSGRRSYIDAVLPAVLGLIPGAKEAISFSVAPRYYDYQVKLERHEKGGHTRFFVTFFGSNDALVAALPNPALDPEGRGTFGTTILYNRLLVGFDTRLKEGVDFRTRTSIGYDEYGLSAGEDLYAKSQQAPFLSRNTFTVKLPALRSTLEAGADLQALPYSVNVQLPPPLKLNQVPDPFASRRLLSEHTEVFSLQPGLFANVIVAPVTPLKIVAGLRGDWNSQLSRGWVDPRLSAFVQLHEQVLVKAAVGLYHQQPDYRQGQLSPTFGNPHLLPEAASQYMVGGEAHFTDAISLDVQLYYKDLFHQSRATLAAGSTADLTADTPDLHYTSTGRGKSYGAELLLRHALTKNFFGWVSYSLSRTERDYAGGTQWGLSAFDQPHNLIVVASYKLPYDFIVGAKVRFTSGPLTTPVTGALYDANGNYYFPIFGAQYSQRLPDFFQLDVRVDKRFVFRDWMLALYLDVQNVTNRQNVESVLNSYDYSQQTYLTGLPILPVLGVRAEW